MKGNKIRPVGVYWVKRSENMAYGFDGQHKTSISEEDGKDGNAEVAGKHVHNIRLIVVARGQSVVVRATGNLNSLWDVPGENEIDEGL